MMELIEIDNLDKLREHRNQWDELVNRAGKLNVFLGYPWISCWLKHRLGSRRVAFLLAKKDGRTVGIAPFLHDVDNELLVLPVDDYSEHCDLICDSDSEEFLDAVLTHVKCRTACRRLCLRRMSARTGTTMALRRQVRSHGMTEMARQSWPSPYLEIETTWKEFIASKPASVARRIARRRRELQKTGSIEFVKYAKPADVPTAMQEVLDVERNSWKQQAGTSFTAVAGLADFYCDVAAAFAETGCLRIYVLKLDSQPIAHLFGIQVNGAFHALKVSYRTPQRSALSPGGAVLDYCIQDSFESNTESFELNGEESAWKNEIATGARQYVDFLIEPRNAISISRSFVCNRLKPFVKRRLPVLAAVMNHFKANADN